MAEYVEIGGVRTWFDVTGSGPPLVMLHPGGVDARALRPNVTALAESFRVFTPERRGHGHTPDIDGPITFANMAADTIAFLETVVRSPTRLMGMSDGAIVALAVALARPDLVTQLACVAGPFHLDGWAPGVLDPSGTFPDFMAKMYGEVSPDGIEHYGVIAKKLVQTHAEGPTFATSELARLQQRVLVMFGDDDEVTLEHALAFYRALPKGELAIVPGTSHGLLVEKPAVCNALLREFFANEPVQTYAPIRRK